jgi:hypothetical protein
MPEHHHNDRSALDGWLRHADEVLADQRAYSISPSFAQALAADQPYQTTLTMGTVASGLEALLGRLVDDPGRWILILETGPEPDTLYVQYLLFEDGSLVAEAISDHYMHDPARLGPAGQAKLAALGWRPPSDEGAKNWSRVDDSLSPDVAGAARLGIETLRCVFALGDGDPVRIRMVSSHRRGDTPATSTFAAADADPGSVVIPAPETGPGTDYDPWAAVRAQQWDELDGLPSAIDVDSWAARAARALLVVRGLATEIGRLQAIHPAESTPVPGLDLLLERADSAALDAHEAAGRTKELWCDRPQSEAAAVSCTRSALQAERAARQLAQLLMGVNAAHDNERVDLGDRLAVAVITDPVTGVGLDGDGLEMFADNDDERLPEVAGLICRLLLEPGTKATLGPVTLRSDHDDRLALTVDGNSRIWESPVQVYEPAAFVVEKLAKTGDQ